MSVLTCKNFPLTSGFFFVLFLLSGSLANRNRHLSHRTDSESLEDIQDLLRQAQLAIEMKIESQDLGLERAEAGEEEEEEDGDHDVNHKQCNCSGSVCSCCREIRLLRYRQNGCVKLTYEPDKKAMLVSLTLGSRALPPKEVPVSATQPSPICVRVPRISRRAAACIEFNNYKLEDEAVTGCLTFKAKAFGRTLLTLNLGCFKLELSSSIQQDREVELPYLKEDKDSVEDLEPVYPW